MKRSILWLSLLLGLQLLLFLVPQWTDNRAGQTGPTGKLLVLSPEPIDSLEIDGGAEGRIELSQVEGRWRLPGHFGAAADEAKIAGFLATLLNVERSWPVAETAEASKRFQVADTDYERRLQFKSGEQTLATLLLGSSPGFRKVHARLVGEQQVFDIPFSTFQASLKATDWIDRNILRLAPEQISAIQLPDARLLREAGGFKLADAAAAEQLNAERVRELVELLARLSIQDVLSREDSGEPETAELRVALELSDGSSRQYNFSRGEGELTARLRVGDASPLYAVDGTLLQQLQGFSRQLLTAAPPAEDPPPPQPQDSMDQAESRSAQEKNSFPRTGGLMK